MSPLINNLWCARVVFTGAHVKPMIHYISTKVGDTPLSGMIDDTQVLTKGGYSADGCCDLSVWDDEVWSGSWWGRVDDTNVSVTGGVNIDAGGGFDLTVYTNGISTIWSAPTSCAGKGAVHPHTWALDAFDVAVNGPFGVDTTRFSFYRAVFDQAQYLPKRNKVVIEAWLFQ